MKICILGLLIKLFNQNSSNNLIILGKIASIESSNKLGVEWTDIANSKTYTANSITDTANSITDTADNITDTANSITDTANSITDTANSIKDIAYGSIGYRRII